jgi:hypothetical protein
MRMVSPFNPYPAAIGFLYLDPQRTVFIHLPLAFYARPAIRFLANNLCWRVLLPEQDGHPPLNFAIPIDLDPFAILLAGDNRAALIFIQQVLAHTMGINIQDQWIDGSTGYSVPFFHHRYDRTIPYVSVSNITSTIFPLLVFPEMVNSLPTHRHS